MRILLELIRYDYDGRVLTLVAISSLYAEQSFAAKSTPCHGQYYLLFEANEAQFSSIRSYYYLTTTSA